MVKLFTPKLSVDSNLGISRLMQKFGLEFYSKSNIDHLELTRELLRLDPISRFCVEVTYLHLFVMWKEYHHDKKRITRDINDSINHCKGSWFNTLRSISSCYWYGHSFSEVAVSNTALNRKKLSEIYTYDPLKFDYVIKHGKIDHIRYYDSTGVYVEIPYSNGIHLVIGADTSFDNILGCGRVESALPYWELHKLIMPVLAIAAQRQATPILVKKTETGEDIILVNQETGQVEYDSTTGEPVVVKKGWDSLQQLEQLGSAGITVIDPDDELFAITLNVSYEFLLGLIKITEQYRMISFLTPTTIFSITNSGVGDSGLSEVHMKVFQKSVLSMARNLSEEIIEKLIRPLIIYNYGKQSDYGYFILDEGDDMAIEIAKVAISALGKGKPELEDLETLNRIRRALGIPELNDFISSDELPTRNEQSEETEPKI